MKYSLNMSCAEILSSIERCLRKRFLREDIDGINTWPNLQGVIVFIECEQEIPALPLPPLTAQQQHGLVPAPPATPVGELNDPITKIADELLARNGLLSNLDPPTTGGAG